MLEREGGKGVRKNRGNQGEKKAEENQRTDRYAKNIPSNTQSA